MVIARLLKFCSAVSSASLFGHTTCVIFGLCLLPALSFAANESTKVILPSEEYRPELLTPGEHLGFEVGDQHLLPEQINSYLTNLALQSNRVQFQMMGRTHEHRSQLLITISSPKNLANLEKIITQHRDGKAVKDQKLVIWLGYSIHGNEPSGANASVLLAYHLAASTEKSVADLLENTIVIIEPVMNPDGLAKFAQYVNAYRGKTIVSDPSNKEHNEPWPGSRTNHYWFDLNRDWLLLTQPESKNRLRWFHHYKPHLLGDFHEMGWNSTYFFQPGAPSRKHPLIPKKNYAINASLMEGVASAFDERGVLYYSGETFDDFYFGKGSTYPDINGAIGILYEQASARAHLRETDNGLLALRDTVKNQFDASLATLKSAHAKRKDLLSYQKSFFEEAAKEAINNTRQRAMVFGDPADRGRTLKLVRLLQKHQIVVHQLAKKLRVQGEVYLPEHHFIVPMQQPQYRLIQALFDERTTFENPIFYDVSAWNMGMAYNVPFTFLRRGDYSKSLLGLAAAELPVETSTKSLAESSVGYLLSWNDYEAPKALAFLIKNQIKVKFSTKELVIGESKSSTLEFPRGTLFVPARRDLKPSTLRAYLSRAIQGTGMEWFPLAKGSNAHGIDLGSPHLRPIEMMRVALIVGDNVDAYQAGSLWHYLDQHIEFPLTLLAEGALDTAELHRYTHMIMANGDYKDWPATRDERLYAWIKNGGRLVALGGAAKWVAKMPESQTRLISEPEVDQVDPIPFASKQAHEAAKLIGGAITRVELDTTHPLAFGFSQESLFTFRRGTDFLELPRKPFVTVGRYAKNALATGYISKENQVQLNGSAMLIAEPYGEGHITVFADNPYFRAYWLGGAKLLANALFFGGNY